MRLRPPALVATAGLLVAVLAGAWLWRSDDRDRSRLADALDTLPAGTEIASYTDWRAVRDELGSDVTGSSPAAAKQRLLDAAYERDLTAVTVLGVSEAEVHAAYGWSPLDAEWEVYGQSPAGAVEVLRMPDGFDFAAAADRLTALGYAAPDDAGVRRGGPDLVAGIAAGLTPQLANVALLPEQHLVVASDLAAYAARTVETATGERTSAADGPEIGDVSAALDADPVAALVLVGDRACTVSGFATSDPATRALARQRVQAAGGVTAYQGLTLALERDGGLTLVMHYDDGDTAEADLDARRVLATGEAPAQGGTFDERFSVAGAEVRDTDLVLELDPRRPDSRLLSDLGRGSLLPAVC